LEIEYTQLEKQTNTEHGEVNLQMKRACLCTQRTGLNLIEFGVVKKCFNKV